MDRLNVDFKGPLPSVTNNRFLLVVVDEYSRYTWGFACPNAEAKTVIKCLTQLFCMFGMPNYVHSDNGPCFKAEEYKQFLHTHGIATSRSTRYNPRGNSQVERFNGVLWKSIQLSLSSLNLPDFGMDIIKCRI